MSGGAYLEWVAPIGGAALRNANGVVSSDRLEGHEVVNCIYGPTGLAFGTVGAALGQLLGSRLRQRREQRFGAVPLLCG